VNAERLSGLDASFLYLETPTLHMHVAITAVLDPATLRGGYRFDRFRSHIHDRLPLAPVFRRRLVEIPFGIGHPVWTDDPDFDIENHVHRAALPTPGSAVELAELTAEIVSTKLDRTRPLWEIWLVEGVTGGRVALIGKMHHATVDGVTGAELLGVLLDVEPQAVASTPPVPALEPHALSGVDLVTSALGERVRGPVELVRTAYRTGQAVLDVARMRQRGGEQLGALPLTAPRTSLNGAVTSRRRVAFAAIGLDDVRALKNAAGVTVNDVVLAVATSVLRRYLDAGDELPAGPLVAMVPVSVAPDAGDPHGANRISVMFVRLPTHVDDPAERLRAIHEGMRGAKEAHDALGASMLQDWAEHAAPNLFALSARVYSRMHLAELHRPLANVVISNVPGPRFPLYLGGAELQATFPFGPVMEGLGLNMTIMSYRDGLYWGFLSCARAVPRLADLASTVPASLVELLAAHDLEPTPFTPPVDLGEGRA